MPIEVVKELHRLRENDLAQSHRLGHREDVDQHRARLDWYMWQLHEAGFSLRSLGAAVGLTRQRIQQRLARAGPVDSTQALPDLPPPPEPPPAAVPTSRPAIPVETGRQLETLQELAKKLRGGMGPQHPSRVASEELSALLAELSDQGFWYRELATALGVTRQAVRSRLARHGYKTLPPSQKSFRGRRLCP